MEEVHENKEIQEFCSAESVDIVLMAEALRDSIPRDKAKINAFRVLDYLARRTIELVREGREPLVSTKEIHIDLDGNPNQEPSAWLSPLWTAIDTKVYDQIEEAVIDRCRRSGLAKYPRPARREGSPTRYTLEMHALEGSHESSQSGSLEKGLTSAGVVTYEQDLTLALSPFGRLVFGGGLVWTRSKKVMLALMIFGITGAMLFVFYGGYFALSRNHAPLSSAGLITLLIVFGVPWITMRWLERSMRIFDDRIVIAPDWALAWEEFGATVEIEGEAESGRTKAIKVARYTAQCPICDGMLKLDRGEPDFPRRVVGRCSKSPREHVFSFDRVTRRGRALITPP